MSDPSFVAISDVHYSLNTYQIADIAFRAAIDKAAELKVPLIDLGDLTNDKAILRAECVNTLINTFKYAVSKNVSIHLLVGNHSLLNEKSYEHALHFLSPYANIIDKPTKFLDILYIPYQSDSNKIIDLIKDLSEDTLILMHQGVKGAFMGDYIVDKTSIDPEVLAPFKVFSGHYHRHQTVGSITYVGNPYSLSFGEANDGPKGFLIVNKDGSFTREILKLRAHKVIECQYSPFTLKIMLQGMDITKPSIEDIVWLKVKAPKSILDSLDRAKLGNDFVGHSNFKLDKIGIDSDAIQKSQSKNISSIDILDSLIDALSEPVAQTKFLKNLWRKTIA